MFFPSGSMLVKKSIIKLGGVKYKMFCTYLYVSLVGIHTDFVKGHRQVKSKKSNEQSLSDGRSCKIDFQT